LSLWVEPVRPSSTEKLALAANQTFVFQFYGYSGAFPAACVQLSPQFGLKHTPIPGIGDQV
jgi:hypothetical protein